MRYRALLLTLISCCLLAGCSTDWLGALGGRSGTGSVAGVTSDEIALGLKEALGRGVDYAVTNLGREGGFLQNFQVRIPLPESLQPVEQTLRTLGQGQLVDEFRTAINRAAEKAVPQAAAVLENSIQQMKLADAVRILRGPETAATDYFRATSDSILYQRFLSIVKQATASTGVTAAYKRMTEGAGSALSE